MLFRTGWIFIQCNDVRSGYQDQPEKIHASGKHALLVSGHEISHTEANWSVAHLANMKYLPFPYMWTSSLKIQNFKIMATLIWFIVFGHFLSKNSPHSLNIFLHSERNISPRSMRSSISLLPLPSLRIEHAKSWVQFLCCSWSYKFWNVPANHYVRYNILMFF